MLVIIVQVKVKSEAIEGFKKVTAGNAQSSRKEPGIARFDVLQQTDDPTRFVLIEAYRTEQAPAAHKETDHYKRWRDAVADMMAEPRQSIRYGNIDPMDAEY